MGKTGVTGGGLVTLQTIPRVHDEAALRQVGGRWVAATSDDRLHTFGGPEGVSEVAERIVSLVDGERTVAEIVQRLIEEFEVSREVTEADTLQFISELVHKQVLNT
jgi:hypothetical protein